MVNLQSVQNSRDGQIKKVRNGFNAIREKTDFIPRFMPGLASTNTGVANMTTKREAGIHIASSKVNCNESDKSMPHFDGSNLFTVHEDQHTRNFDNLICRNLKQTFHQQQSLQHNLPLELKDRILSKQFPKTTSQEPNMMKV